MLGPVVTDDDGCADRRIHVPVEPLVDGLTGFGPRTALRFDDDGFTFKSLVANARFAWSDIDGSFEARGRAVVFNLTPEALARRSAWADGHTGP